VADGLQHYACTTCGYDFPLDVGEAALRNGDNPPCPNCGKSLRTAFVQFSTTLTTAVSMKAVGRRARGVRRRFLDLRAGASWNRDRQRYVDRVMNVDRDADTYDEVVADPETGEVIHECHEPLSEHRGHGKDVR